MSAKDSRRDPRTKILSLTVRYKSATVAQFVENHSYDVSRGGLFIRTGSPFPAGTLLKFQVRIAGEQKLIEGVGRVTWRREQDSSSGKPAGMGVKFIKIADESIALIDELVSRRNEAASQFEEGAQDQGIPLSDPPPNLRSGVTQSPASGPARPAFARAPGVTSTTDRPSSNRVLTESTALLEQVRAQAESLPDSDRRFDAPGSWLEDRTSSTSSETEAVDEEERATLPTGEALRELANQLRRSDAPPPPSVASSDSAPSSDMGSSVRSSSDPADSAAYHDRERPDTAGEAAEDADEHSEAAESEEDSYSTNSSAPPAGGSEPPRDSKRPKGKRGKRKNPKKRKKKFRYSSLPAPPPGWSDRPSVKAPEQRSDTNSVPASSRPAVSSAPEATNGASRWWLAALAATVLGGGLLLYFGTAGEERGAPVSEESSPTAAATGASQARLDVPIVAPPTTTPDAEAPHETTFDEEPAQAPAGSVAPKPAPPKAAPKPRPQRVGPVAPKRVTTPPKPVAPPAPAIEAPATPPEAPATPPEPPASAPEPKPTAGPVEAPSLPPAREEAPAPEQPANKPAGPTGAAPQPNSRPVDDEVLGSRR